MNCFKLFSILVITLFLCNKGYSQYSKDSLTSYYLELAKTKITEQKYEEANAAFKKLFARKTVVPDELAYYYGYMLLNLSRYNESRIALQKYIALQGSNGPLSAKAQEALVVADCRETGYRDVFIECDVCYGDSTIDVDCKNCNGKGSELCKTCNGSGVSQTTNNFGTSFQTCKRCAGEKIIKCTACKGSLKEHLLCYNCNGKGRKTIRKKCLN